MIASQELREWEEAAEMYLTYTSYENTFRRFDSGIEQIRYALTTILRPKQLMCCHTTKLRLKDTTPKRVRSYQEPETQYAVGQPESSWFLSEGICSLATSR